MEGNLNKGGNESIKCRLCMIMNISFLRILIYRERGRIGCITLIK